MRGCTAARPIAHASPRPRPIIVVAVQAAPGGFVIKRPLFVRPNICISLSLCTWAAAYTFLQRETREC
eukprot:scaffold4284_cov113-Isochrysis_galbana.AAC.9